MGIRVYEYDLGRSFITAPPIPEPGQLAQLIGFESSNIEAMQSSLMTEDVKASYRVHRVRQLTEVALSLLFTFGLMRVLRKPKGL